MLRPYRTPGRDSPRQPPPGEGQWLAVLTILIAMVLVYAVVHAKTLH
jgi:hypothetical protein